MCVHNFIYAFVSNVLYTVNAKIVFVWSFSCEKIMLHLRYFKMNLILMYASY